MGTRFCKGDLFWLQSKAGLTGQDRQLRRTSCPRIFAGIRLGQAVLRSLLDQLGERTRAIILAASSGMPEDTADAMDAIPGCDNICSVLWIGNLFPDGGIVTPLLPLVVGNASPDYKNRPVPNRQIYWL